MLLSIPFVTKNEIEVSKHSKSVSECKNFMNFELFLPEMCSLSKEIAFLRCNNYQYVPGIMLVENFFVYEITNVLRCDLHSDEYYFVCQKYDVIEFNHSYNAIEIKKSDNNFIVINFNRLKSKKPHEKKVSLGKVFIIAETLDVFNFF